jgi:hypothetical protein
MQPVLEASLELASIRAGFDLGQQQCLPDIGNVVGVMRARQEILDDPAALLGIVIRQEIVNVARDRDAARKVQMHAA